MNKVIKIFGLATVAATAYGILACDSDSSTTGPTDVNENPKSEIFSSSSSYFCSEETNCVKPLSSSTEELSSSYLESSSSVISCSGEEGLVTNCMKPVCENIMTETLEVQTCDLQDDEIALDCFTGNYFMCIDGYWLMMEGCDATQKKCGFDNYTLCEKTSKKKFCKDDSWIEESCINGVRYRYVYYNDDLEDSSHSLERYLCIDNKWQIMQTNCGPDDDCIL